MSAQILVVEDDSAIQELIAASLVREGYVLTRATDVESARRSVSAALPDLILLDWMLPGMSGIDFARELRGQARTRDLPLIMLTAKSQEADRVNGLDVGADDYITKPFSPRELAARVRALLRRQRPHVTDRAIEANGLQLDPVTQRVKANEQLLSLGPTEFRLLKFLMSHPERVYSRAQLLDQVWGDHVYVEERTVDVHVRRVRSALEPSGHDAMVQTVRGTGYRFSTQAPTQGSRKS